MELNSVYKQNTFTAENLFADKIVSNGKNLFFKVVPIQNESDNEYLLSRLQSLLGMDESLFCVLSEDYGNGVYQHLACNIKIGDIDEFVGICTRIIRDDACGCLGFFSAPSHLLVEKPKALYL